MKLFESSKSKITKDKNREQKIKIVKMFLI